MIFPLETIRLAKSNQINFNQTLINIMDGFDFYRRQTPLMGENMIYCNHCQMQTCGNQINSMYSSPEYLIINLYRGKGKKIKY